MFNINLDDIKSIAGEVNTVSYPTVSKEQLQELFVCEALQYMSRRDLAPDAKNQAIYNKEMAATLREDVTSAPQMLVELTKKNVAAVRLANASGDESKYIAAQSSLEMFLSFLSQIVGAMARSAFYTRASAMASESRTIDLVRQGNEGSYYAGPRTAVVLPETVEESINEIVGFFSELYDTAVSMASQWFKQRSPALQLGGKQEEEGWVAFLTIEEMWSDIEATRNERIAAAAAARSGALGSAKSLINGLRASSQHGSISGDKPEPVVSKAATALDKLSAKQCGVTVKAWMQLSEEEQLARLQAVQQ